MINENKIKKSLKQINTIIHNLNPSEQIYTFILMNEGLRVVYGVEFTEVKKSKNGRKQK